MAIAPAVGLGLLVVFLLGAWVTLMLEDRFIKHLRVQQAQSPDPARKMQIDGWTEKHKERIAIAGGIGLVVALVASFFILPREWFYGAWIVLTIVGVIFGLATFVIFGQKQSAKPIPPSDNAKSRQVVSAPPKTDNPYLQLLIRVKYDQALAERLIAYERSLAPTAGMDELCWRAIARLERDNR